MEDEVEGVEAEFERERDELCLFCCRSLVQLACVICRMWRRELVMLMLTCSLAVTKFIAGDQYRYQDSKNHLSFSYGNIPYSV